MPARNNRRNFALALLVIASCLPAALAAQGRPVLHVRFEYRDRSFKNQFASDADRITNEQALADRIGAILSEKIDIWQFVRGDTTAFPRLDVFIAMDGDAWEVRLALMTGLSNQAAAEWKTPFLEAGDADALATLPLQSEWPARIEQKVRDRILAGTLEEGRCAEVFAALRKWVSLGKEVFLLGKVPAIDADDARAALPLVWEKNCQIAKSVFLISFEWQSNGEVTLKSVGMALPARYDTTKPPGITVRYRKWIQADSEEELGNHLNQLELLKPFDIKLGEFNRYTRPCSVATGTNLSVAPER